jgi:hypothetical protein
LPSVVDVPTTFSSSASATAAAPPTAAAAAAPATDPNKLHALLLRARMLGDAARVASLEAQLASLAAGGVSVAVGGVKRAREEDSLVPDPAPAAAPPVVVAPLDSRGLPLPSLQQAPAGLSRDDLRRGSRAGKVPQPRSLHGPDGHREGYLPGEGGGGAWVGSAPARGSEALAAAAAATGTRMAALAAAERAGGGGGGGGGGMDAVIARNIVRDARYRGDGGGRDGRGEEDGGAGAEDAARLLRDGSGALTAREAQRRDMARAVAAHVGAERATAKCKACLQGGALARHQLVSLGAHSLLMLPPEGQRLPGHMLLVPIAHVGCVVEAVRAPR